MLSELAEKLLRAVLPLSYMIAFALALVIWLRPDA